MHKLVEVIGTPMVVLPVLLDMRAVLASLLALQIVWMLLIPLLLKVVLRDLAMAVHTIAAWRAVEDLATTLGGNQFLVHQGSARMEKDWEPGHLRRS
jgi:hypothetical protein